MVLEVSDDDKKINQKRNHEKLLYIEFAEDRNSFSRAGVASSVACLID